MPLPERSIGFVVERERATDMPTRETAKLVVIDKTANDRFVRNIFEIFADIDKKLEGTKPKIVDHRSKRG